MKTLQSIFIIALLGSSAFGFLTIEDFKNDIVGKCYDYKEGNELINGQTSPLPSSLETFVSIVERLEERLSNPERLLKSLIARFRYDDLLIKFVSRVSGQFQLDYVTRGDDKVKKVHEILQQLFGGGSMSSELRDSDLSEDEQCALYFMISHTVNDTVSPYEKDPEKKETIDLAGINVLRHPQEQGVVNLNTKTRHAFALGKVLLGMLAGLQGNENTISADAIYKSFKARQVPEYLKDVKVNVLHGVTLSDILAVSLQYRRDSLVKDDDILLPNGYWDDSVCPVQYLLDENNGCYATQSLIRGAIDGFILGNNMQKLRETYPDIRVSQILRQYYSKELSASDTYLSEISWCNRHAHFTYFRNEIIKQATSYYQLYAALLDRDGKDSQDIQEQMSRAFDAISSSTNTIFDEMSNEGGECSTSPSRICETPRDITAVLYMNTVETNKDIQNQIIGNLSSGFHMSPSGSSMEVYSNLKSMGGLGLHSINSSQISGCASCAAKYFGYFDTVTTTVVGETEVMRELNRTLTPDDLPSNYGDEAGVPAKVVLYFNFGNPTVSDRDLRRAVSDFRYEHRGTRIFAIGQKKEALALFVENPESDTFTGDVRNTLTTLKERVCKVPAQFQFKNCYKNSRSDEDANAYHGFITPYHTQYWAMYPKYFLKSYKIQMTFNVITGPLKVCYTRNYDDIQRNRQSNMRCLPAEQDKPAVFDESNPCKKRDVHNCPPFYFIIEAHSPGFKRCSDKKCKTPSQIEFEFKHTGISCNRGISFAATPMTLAVSLFMTVYLVFKH